MKDVRSPGPEDGKAPSEGPMMEHTATEEVVPDRNSDARDQAILDHLTALQTLGWRHAMALKDVRNQAAMLEREMTRSRSALEQFLAVTVSDLDQTRATLRATEAERTALAERLAESQLQIRMLAARIADLEAHLDASHDPIRLDGGEPRGQAEAEVALAAALRREADLHFERARSRWIAIGRALRLTKL